MRCHGWSCNVVNILQDLAISHKTRQYWQYRAIFRIIAGIARYCRYCVLSEYISGIARPCHNWRFRQCPQSCRIFLHFY
ncbi:hypothetical protein BD311DRAFT_761898 [Dichomitus squalens]|uniref:Uncharacterized protein n=1 Tax=Dichomitus squalens TaxID=114155 RepID=A0A4Q9MHC7_9APHY|nr:hypothetical protein BD311DRAFT_761898 [Dichomitus squalens]